MRHFKALMAALILMAVSLHADTARLVQPGDLVYQGSFRLPQGVIGGSTFGYGGSGLAFNPANNSLFMFGHPYQSFVAETAIPSVSTTPTTIAGLPIASLLQPFMDATDGLMRNVTTSPSDSVAPGGLMVQDGKLYVTIYVYYDANGSQKLSHFVSGLDLSVQGDAIGPFQVGTTAGYVSGYMTPLPTMWQGPLGATSLTGNCCLSIISRTSYGPALFNMNQTQLGVTVPLPSTPLVYYNATYPLGPWGGDSLLFNGSTNVTGAVLIDNTSTVLFVGVQGTGKWCYGIGTNNPALNGTIAEPGVLYCYDPVNSSKGGHGYPYQYYVWAYDANDLAMVRSGQRLPYDIRPYAVWVLNIPFSNGIVSIGGVAWDPATRRLFISARRNDNDNPLIHVFGVR